MRFAFFRDDVERGVHLPVGRLSDHIKGSDRKRVRPPHRRVQDIPGEHLARVMRDEIEGRDEVHHVLRLLAADERGPDALKRRPHAERHRTDDRRALVVPARERQREQRGKRLSRILARHQDCFGYLLVLWAVML